MGRVLRTCRSVPCLLAIALTVVACSRLSPATSSYTISDATTAAVTSSTATPAPHVTRPAPAASAAPTGIETITSIPPTRPPESTEAVASRTTRPQADAPAATVRTTIPPTALPTATLVPTPPGVAFPPSVRLEPAFGGFVRPVFLTHHGDPDHLFVVEQPGRVWMIDGGELLPEAFLDISDRVGSRASEQGLLSIAFPEGREMPVAFYVNYTDLTGDSVISRFSRSPDARSADAASEEVLLRISQPAANHNGGQLQFGPDGYLYVGTGDGGRGGDPWGNGQNPDTLLGKILRLNVNVEGGYAIPPDNPFVDRPGFRPEIWALGLRNPWRFAFDRATGDLYIADVGQNRYEEVDVQIAGSLGGANYGWNVMEGNHCFQPEKDCDQNGLTLPIAEYAHQSGCSITGGGVYRGSRYPELVGIYFYGDFCSGHLWGLRRAQSGQWETALLLQTGLPISSFGEDAAGELYVLDYGDGQVYHLAGQE